MGSVPFIPHWKTWARCAAFGLVVVGFFVWTEVVLGFSDLKQLKSTALSPWEYSLTMFREHLFHYLRNVFWPFHMRALPHIEPARSVLESGVIVGAGFILATFGLAGYLFRRAPVACWAILCYRILFAPTSSIRPFRLLALDYRQYPSLAFLCLLIILLIGRIRQPMFAKGLLASLLIYWSSSTFILNNTWKTEESFWAQSIRYGATPLAHMNYAMSIQSRDPDLAEHHYREGLRRSPRHVYILINLGLLYIHPGRNEEGLQYVKRAVKLTPS